METPFQYRNANLHIESINLTECASQLPTPFFIYSKKELLRNIEAVKEAASDMDVLPCYALKANFNAALLRIIRDTGFGADVVSGGELYFALKAGFAPEQIVFAGVGKTSEEIKYAIHQNIHSLNLESEEELNLTASIARKLQKKVAIAIRINPDISADTHEYISTGKRQNKFGVSPETALHLFDIAQNDAWLKPAGIHVHIGSQITTGEPYLNSAAFLLEFEKKLKNVGITIDHFDLGGGIGIPYDTDYFHDRTSSQTYIRQILPDYLNAFQKSGLKLILELGRSIVGSTALLVTRVLYRKTAGEKQFLIVDAAMNNLIRPSLYNANHTIIPVQRKQSALHKYDVVGPVCESGDFLGKDRRLPELQQGDLIAITGAGAYGQALSSNYNLRPRIAEYLVDEDKLTTIAKAQTIESIADQYEW